MATKRKHSSDTYEFRKKRRNVLDVSMKGIMCTCNGTERFCVRETYNLLTDYANELFGTEGARDFSQDDCSDELTAEVAALKKETEKPAELRRFQILDSGVKNRLFFQTTVPDPVALVHHIVKTAKTSDERRTRYLMRLTPVEATCKAYHKDIEAAAAKLLDKYFIGEGKTFSIVFNRHNNDFVGRSDIIGELAEMVKFRNPDHKVDLRHPQLTVLVDILRSVCCLSVVPDYMDLHKYNMTEVYARRSKDQVLQAYQLLPTDDNESVTAEDTCKDERNLPLDDDESETIHTSIKDGSNLSFDIVKNVTLEGGNPSLDAEQSESLLSASSKDGGNSVTIAASIKDGGDLSHDNEVINETGSVPPLDADKIETVSAFGGALSVDVSERDTAESSNKDGSSIC